MFKVEVLKSYNRDVASRDLIRQYNFDVKGESLITNLSPLIILMRNLSSLAAMPKIYKSSGSESYDMQILEWLNEYNHLDMMPEGFLKLTFYPN